MAELVTSMVIGPLVSMVKEKAFSYLLEKYKVMEGMEEQHELLKRKLPAILDVISDAEEQAAAHREGAKAWLEALLKAAYQANDLFDEFKYEALRREAKKKGHYKNLGTDVIKLFPTHNNPIVFRYRMGNKLRRILNAFEVLVADMNAFSFRSQPQIQKSMDWREMDSEIFDPMNIASRSRANDKQKIVSMLLDQPRNVDLMVLPIVGMGGLGKTTLAQIIYNDSEVQKHFQLLLWVCVSDNFDVVSLAKSIVEAAKKKNDSESSRTSPLDSLKEVVSGKRYLLVLDDVWNREVSKWEKLKSRLLHGGIGSSVLLTTRDERVALLMGTTEESYKLESLDENFMKEIIETRAFSSQKERPPKLVEMVGDVAKRCAGSPLAATALGSVLRTKTTVDEWKAVLSRSTICDEENGILPILKLSYNNLPPRMRQCFAFCAVFPKDHEIDVEMLIQLWMANGFVPEQGGCPEIIGKQIFMELSSRSFFQDVKRVPFDMHKVCVDVGVFLCSSRSEHGHFSRITCKIHDLMHDVAQLAVGKECATIATRPSESENFPYSARHLYLSCDGPDTVLKKFLGKGMSAIQTLICHEDVYQDSKLLSERMSVRALKIRQGSILKPKYLHHLRYIDLSSSDIKALPEDISILYHLQTLNLSRCYYLEQLPLKMKYMTALRHLYTHECPNLKNMPPDLRYLTSLQTLTCFVVGTCSGCSTVAELRQLDLGGQLVLKQLESVTEADAKAANLGNKKKLTELTLRWTWTDRHNEAQNNQNEVLEGLKPHDELKFLRIYSYEGNRYPSWISTLQHVVELVLIHCKKTQKTPSTVELPALQVLLLHGMEDLHCLFDTDAPFTFQKLKDLTLDNIPNFETWWNVNEVQGAEPIFPQVEKLSIRGCKRLTTLPKASNVISELSGRVKTVCRSAFPVLKEMILGSLSKFQRWEAGEGTPGKEVTFPQLETLKIWLCPKLTTLPEAPNLSELHVTTGNQKISVQEASKYITSLSYLKLLIEGREATLQTEQTSSELVHAKQKWDCKSPLTAMELYGCNLFFHSTALSLWTCFVQLVDLEIGSCDALVYWPEKMFQGLVSLRKLGIVACSKLTGRTQSSDQYTTEQGELLPRLETLGINGCASLVEVPNLPARLNTLRICKCLKLESITFSEHAGVTVPEYSGDANTRFLPCLESLTIEGCNGLSKVLNLPPSIKNLNISGCFNLQSLAGKLDAVQILRIQECSRLESLESCLGELPSLEELELKDCKSLVSLPNGRQAYSSLRVLRVKSCPAIVPLPPSLQQHLGYLEEKELDAWQEHEEPKIRKNAISRLVRLK